VIRFGHRGPRLEALMMRVGLGRPRIVRRRTSPSDSETPKHALSRRPDAAHLARSHYWHIRLPYPLGWALLCGHLFERAAGSRRGDTSGWKVTCGLQSRRNSADE